MDSRQGVILQLCNWANGMSRILQTSWFWNVKFPDQLSDSLFLNKAYAQRSQAEVVSVDWMYGGKFMMFLNAFLRCGCAFRTYSFLTWHTFRFLPSGCKPRLLIQWLVLLAAAWKTEAFFFSPYCGRAGAGARSVTYLILNNQLWPVLEMNTRVLIVTRLDMRGGCLQPPLRLHNGTLRHGHHLLHRSVHCKF
jgi:hypothetical protein